MAIKHGLLAILNEGEAHGYQLKTEFEGRTGNTWPLNIGQVYTTLARCERDGLITSTEPDDEGKITYRLSPLGRAEVRDWFASPVERTTSPRDELAIKLSLALTAPNVDVAEIVRLQRTETMRNLQELTRLKMDLDPVEDLSWSLLLDRHIFDAEAEARWLDHCEAKLSRTQGRKKSAPATADRVDSPIKTKGGTR